MKPQHADALREHMRRKVRTVAGENSVAGNALCALAMPRLATLAEIDAVLAKLDACEMRVEEWILTL